MQSQSLVKKLESENAKIKYVIEFAKLLVNHRLISGLKSVIFSLFEIINLILKMLLK